MSNEQKPQQQPATTAQANKEITDLVLARVLALQSSGELQLPPNYSPGNALNTALLILQGVENKQGEKALVKCTRQSIANALLDMVLQGLSPGKKQCYFVMYGNKLEMQRSYMGTYAVAKRVAGVKDVNAQTVYEGDEFVYEIDTDRGVKKVVKHVQKLEDINPDPSKIKGAYAVITFEDGSSKTEIMNIRQIRAAWNMGASGGNSPAHKNFGDEMAEKTVTARALKLEINSSSDAALYADKGDDSNPERIEAKVKHEIENNSSIETIGFSETKPLEEQKSEAVIIEIKETPQPETVAAEKAEKKEEGGEKKTGTLFKNEPNF